MFEDGLSPTSARTSIWYPLKNNRTSFNGASNTCPKISSSSPTITAYVVVVIYNRRIIYEYESLFKSSVGRNEEIVFIFRFSYL